MCSESRRPSLSVAGKPLCVVRAHSRFVSPTRIRCTSTACVAMAAENRLREERKNWRRDHPYGFVAKPITKPDGTQDLFEWDIRIPARQSSVWYPGVYEGRLSFTADYPVRPPSFKFKPIEGEPLFHPNVYTDGNICMSIINPPESTHGYGKGGNWSISITIKQVLLAVQLFMDEASGYAAGREEAYRLYNHDRAEYNRRVKQQVAKVDSVPGAAT